MSKASRRHKHDEKMARRRAAKLARKNLYASMAGTSKRRKRQRCATRRSPQRGMHVMHNCGNIGCARCFPHLQYA